MRLSDAGLRRPKTKAVYPNHRLPPCLNEAAARDRPNRLLCAAMRDGDITQYRIAADLNPATSGSLELCCFDGTSIGCSLTKSARYELIRLAEPQSMGRSHQVARVRGVRQRRKVRAECGGRAWRWRSCSHRDGTKEPQRVSGFARHPEATREIAAMLRRITIKWSDAGLRCR
jgi:hypothetical protein